ncbi:hypothetical protein D9M69_613900 [compost metagenome]
MEGAGHVFEPGPFLAQDEALCLRQLEVGAAFGVVAQHRAVALVGGEAVETDQAPGDVIAAFVRQEVAEQVAAAAGNDAAPGLGVAAEGLALEGVDLIADEAGDGHGWACGWVEQGLTVRLIGPHMLRSAPKEGAPSPHRPAAGLHPEPGHG